MCVSIFTSMKFLFLPIYTFIVMAMSISDGFANNYYLSDEKGDDNRSIEEAQNPATPWKTIEKINSQFDIIKPGDSILFKRGETFYGTLHIKASGSPTSPVIIGAYGTGLKPIFTSFQEIKAWKAKGNGIYESTAAVNSDAVKVVLINENIHEMGRYPNVDMENDGYLTIDKVRTNMIQSDQLISTHDWKGADVIIRTKDWVINRYNITSQTGQQIHYNGGISNYKAQEGYGFFISNHISTLDSFGEWYFNPSTKKISVYLGNVNPSTLKVKVSTLDNLLTKDYRESYVRVENIQFKGANGNNLHLEGGDHIVISDSEIEFSGEDGIHSRGVSDLIIERNIVRHSYNNGMYLKYGNNQAIVRDNEVTNTAMVIGRTQNDDAAGIGIFASGEKILVQNNSVINTGFNGIQFSGNHTVVKNNFIDTYCLIKSDGGGIYTFGGVEYQAYTGRKIEGNIVVNGIGKTTGVPKRGVEYKVLVEGIFLDDNSNNISIIGNTVGNTTNSGLKIANGNTIYVSNNSFFNNQYSITLGNSSIGQDTRKVDIEKNQFFTKLADQYSYGIKTHKNDISLMADFDNNYFFRPLSDEYSINHQYTKNGVVESAVDDLSHWSAKHAKDRNSTSNSIEFSRYTVRKKIGNSLYPNTTFERNIAGLSCNDCQSSWQDDSKMAGGALKVTSSASSSVKLNLGALKKDKTYLLSVKAYANKEGPLAFNLRFTDSPWERLSPISTFNIDKEVNTYEVLISPYQDENEVSLMISSSEKNMTYWLDDLEFVEAEAYVVNPDEVMLFEVNPSNSNKTITLSGTYVNAKLEQFSGKVTIPPYGSLTLFKLSEKSKANENLEDLHYHTWQDGSIEFNEINFEKINNEFISNSNFNTNTSASNEKIFQSERYASLLELQIPIENGTYTIKTYHNELYFGKGGPAAKEGNRVFDILIEDKVVKKDFDLFIESNNEPVTHTFESIDIIDGVLNLKMLASANNASISGLSIIREKAAGPPISDYTYFLNTGGETDAELIGITYLAETATDSHYNEGSGRFENAELEAEPMFQTERNGKNLVYNFPIPNGTYTVFTMHNELWFGHEGGAPSAGKRVFDITLEGETLKSNFDIFEENKNYPMLLSFENIVVDDGILSLQMTAKENNASISGIALIGTEVKNNNIKSSLKSLQQIYNNRHKEEEFFTGSEDDIRIFPNPAKGDVQLEINTIIGKGSVYIHNMNGHLLSHFDWNKTTEEKLNIPIDNLSKGLYLLSVSNEQTIIYQQKLVVSP